MDVTTRDIRHKRGEGDDDRPIIHGPILSATDEARFRMVSQHQARSDLTLGWSSSDNLTLSIISDKTIEVCYTITNVGDRPSIGATLLLVAWGVYPAEVGYLKIPPIEKIPSAPPTQNSVGGQMSDKTVLSLDNLTYGPGATPIATTSRLTAVYLVTYDSPFDPPDAIATDLYMHAKRGTKYFGEGNIHPCRLSRQVSCSIPSNGAFIVNGNAIQHQVSGYLDFFLTDRGTAASADIYIRPDNELLFSNIKSLGFGPNISRAIVPAGAIEIVLIQDGHVATSLDPSRAQISVPNTTTNVLSINWNDPAGDDNDFGDFIMTLVHR